MLSCQRTTTVFSISDSPSVPRAYSMRNVSAAPPIYAYSVIGLLGVFVGTYSVTRAQTQHYSSVGLYIPPTDSTRDAHNYMHRRHPLSRVATAHVNRLRRNRSFKHRIYPAKKSRRASSPPATSPIFPAPSRRRLALRALNGLCAGLTPHPLNIRRARTPRPIACPASEGLAQSMPSGRDASLGVGCLARHGTSRMVSRTWPADAAASRMRCNGPGRDV
ncbi:hypothetical protein BD311DRAFT_313174 [Dichomitus squalens]|uniref:Uncharacterized protein n=1 Tax=Dichomitus squalens TaxID=114155 RepID=A0A4Q9MNI7_9APHY|nr:hypothetical protein BD311DRAFT_313174 [Dichomitus squalens]